MPVKNPANRTFPMDLNSCPKAHFSTLDVETPATRPAGFPQKGAIKILGANISIYMYMYMYAYTH